MYEKLEKVADIFTGARLSRYNEHNTKKQSVIKKIYPNNQVDYEDEEISINLDNKYYSCKGDILVQLAKPNTITIVNEDGLIIPMFYSVIRVKEGYDSSYIYNVLKYDVFPKYQNILIEGSALQIIRINSLKELKIPIVPDEYQSKIGGLLNLVDKKRDLYEKLIETDERVKKAILNNYVTGED